MRLANLSWLRNLVIGSKRLVLTRFFKIDLHPTADFSMTAKFDLTNPQGVHVGAYSMIAFDAAILTHDRTRGVRRHTRIGERCFIGARSIILPGVSIGDGSIVGAGAVVNKDVPPGCIVAGNPARIIREGIQVGPYGRFASAYQVQLQESALYGFTQ